MKNNSGLTLVEMLIIMALFAVLAILGIGLLNPFQQIKKAWDGKRKNNLDILRKVFEDHYNDKSAYPLPAEVCYDSPTDPRTDSFENTACSCHLCGYQSGSPNFNPYLGQIPCDPQKPQKQYLYDYDCSSSKPGWYRIYTKLSITTDPDIARVGCSPSCGPQGSSKYNYYVGTVPPEGPCPGFTRLYQFDQNGVCNICRSPSSPLDVCNYTKPVYINISCSSQCN